MLLGMLATAAVGHAFTIESPDGIWTLLTETDVDGYYCGSHLSDFTDGTYTIAYPMPGALIVAGMVEENLLAQTPRIQMQIYLRGGD